MILNSSVYCFLSLIVTLCTARKHRLLLTNEMRSVVHLTTFGYFTNGSLEVRLNSLRLPEDKLSDLSNKVGFSLSRSRVNGVLAYNTEETVQCTLTKTKSDNSLFLFIIDPVHLSVQVKTLNQNGSVLRARLLDEGQVSRTKRDGVNDQSANDADSQKGNAGAVQGDGDVKVDGAVQGDGGVKVDEYKNAENNGTDGLSQVRNINGVKLLLKKSNNSYDFSFVITMGAQDEGLYNLNFHNCYNSRVGHRIPYSLSVSITEENPDGFLSAAEIPLPRLYISMAIMFLIAALVWTHTLLKHRDSVFKIHWLMASLAYTKTVSLIFHSINYHFINTEGHPIEGWAVMYYITHLLKGALLFITLALIGTGFAFIKYILSDKEKKIFVIVIPLQVLANVAYIIIEETEEGASEYAMWKNILFLVDLICCGAILFPVVWSIRHLQEASSTDGKAAVNLEKLKLFRHYYVMIVCYIYFTRIIAILLKVTVPFQWQWCQEFLVEVSTLVFFVLTGFKFKPASNNPYLQLPLDEEDLEMDEVVTESGALEGVSKVKKTANGRDSQRTRQRDPAL